MDQLLRQQYEVSRNLVLRPLGASASVLCLSVPCVLLRQSEIFSQSLTLCYPCFEKNFTFASFTLLQGINENI